MTTEPSAPGSRVRPSTFVEDPRPLVALDWSLRRIHVTFDGMQVLTFGDTDELLDRLTTPHRIVAESTFESWDPERRLGAVARLRSAGHEIYVYRPNQTARVRTELGWDKSDTLDARVIHRIAAGNLRHLYPLPTPDPAWQRFRSDANRDYAMLRLTGQKADLVSEAERALPPFRTLPEEAQKALGNPAKGTYSATLLAAVHFTAQRCATRAEAERLLGLHGSAFPTLLRAELLTHSFRHARNRGVPWTAYRRHLRHTYRLLRDHVDAQA